MFTQDLHGPTSQKTAFFKVLMWFLVAGTEYYGLHFRFSRGTCCDIVLNRQNPFPSGLSYDSRTNPLPYDALNYMQLRKCR
jgi:hypothetical protein